MYRGISEELLDFLQKSPTAFHAVENIKKELNKDGFVELLEGKPWKWLQVENIMLLVIIQVLLL